MYQSLSDDRGVPKDEHPPFEAETQTRDGQQRTADGALAVSGIRTTGQALSRVCGLLTAFHGLPAFNARYEKHNYYV